ncbi:MAG TPA: DUF4105 domain-containing protein [Gemmatimonadaceae bacterium]|nr:DUF4105 domain-containing protein [Gemmatimonadaceae bacterium]
MSGISRWSPAAGRFQNRKLHDSPQHGKLRPVQLYRALFPVLLALAPAPVTAEQPATSPAPLAPFQAPAPVMDTTGEPLSIYLITVGQGDPYWTRFGHNALWIRDRQRGTDIAYNWGLFDFNEPGFLSRFLSGNTRYWMAGFDTWDMLQVYRSENRSIDVQELALTPEQARDLQQFAEWNALPENRTYRYDYYLDNCSTRIRDAIDRVLSGQIRLATDSILTHNTYRSHTQRLLADHAPTWGGIMLVLGQPADNPITAWDEMFIPMLMRDHLRAVTVTDGAGGSRPLVSTEWRMLEPDRPPERAAAPNRAWSYTTTGLLLGLLIGLLAWGAGRGGWPPVTRTAAAILLSAWSILAGAAGLVVIGMWALTHHIFMYGNENVLQVTPLSLALALLIPLSVRSRPGPRAAYWATLLAFTILGLSLIGFILQLLPLMNQRNGEIIGLALPLHAATAYAVWRLSHGSEPASSLSDDAHPASRPVAAVSDTGSDPG